MIITGHASCWGTGTRITMACSIQLWKMVTVKWPVRTHQQWLDSIHVWWLIAWYIKQKFSTSGIFRQGLVHKLDLSRARQSPRKSEFYYQREYGLRLIIISLSLPNSQSIWELIQMPLLIQWSRNNPPNAYVGQHHAETTPFSVEIKKKPQTRTLEIFSD